VKYDPLKSSLLLFFFGFLLNSSLYAGEFHSWVDLNKYYKKNNFIPEILKQENIGHLPIISELPNDFSEIQDVPKPLKSETLKLSTINSDGSTIEKKTSC